MDDDVPGTCPASSGGGYKGKRPSLACNAPCQGAWITPWNCTRKMPGQFAGESTSWYRVREVYCPANTAQPVKNPTPRSRQVRASTGYCHRSRRGPHRPGGRLIVFHFEPNRPLNSTRQRTASASGSMPNAIHSGMQLGLREEQCRCAFLEIGLRLAANCEDGPCSQPDAKCGTRRRRASAPYAWNLLPICAPGCSILDRSR